MVHPALKRLERSAKAVLFAAAERLFGGARRPPPVWGSRQHRVLYLRYDRIGDMIMATGLIRAVATSHPTIELDVLASPGNRSVLDGNPHVRRVHVLDRRRLWSYVSTVRALRRERYDAVIAGMLVPSATTMLLMLATGAPWRIGIEGRRNDFVYTLPVPHSPPDALFVEQIGQSALAFGVDPATTDWRYELYLRDDERARAEALWQRHPGTPRLLVNVSAFTRDRRWPAERYAAVVRHLREHDPGASVLITGDPGDWAAAVAAAELGGAVAVNVSPVREVFALIAAADAIVTPDTSLAHAAAATGTPAGVLFTAAPAIYAPYGGRIVRIVSPGDTLEDLQVAAVLPAVDRLLAIVAASPRPG
ncbi:MAG TPA: glycosyltransferase family 9 protein [Gemmatimonadaceae bacterium]|nr:glycosyltransferase family 9 protein [Gemmatimonadaceae bacterium]